MRSFSRTRRKEAGFSRGARDHEANAAQVSLWLVLNYDVAKCTNDFLGIRTKGHHTLILCWNREVVQCEASHLTAITMFFHQAPRRNEDIVFSTAHHGDSIMLMTNITQFVVALGSSETFLFFDALNQLRDVIKSGRLGRCILWSSRLLLLMGGCGNHGLGCGLGIFFVGLASSCEGKKPLCK